MNDLDGAVDLSRSEVAALAAWLIADRLEQCGEWALWEYVPCLSEGSYLEVLAAIGRTAENMTALAVEAGGVEVFRMVS